jgi:hypothetical protein
MIKIRIEDDNGQFQEIVVAVGLKYKSLTFSASATIYAIRKEVDQVDILYTDSEGLQWVAQNCSLHALAEGFKNGTHYEVKPDIVNISIQ